MKIKIQTKTLLENLQLSNLTTSNVNLNPFLVGILIEAHNNQITLSSSNSNYQGKIIIKNDFECFEEGKILIKGSLLLNLISKIDSDSVELTTVEDNVLNISNGKGIYNLNLMDTTGFPILDFDHKNAQELIIPVDLLRKVLLKIFPCVANTSLEQNRFLNGILFDSTRKENYLEIVGTDSFHLAYTKKEIKVPKLKFIISPETLRFIENIAKNEKEIHLFINEQKIFVLVSDNIFICRLIDGQYPSFYKVLENNYPFSFTLKNKEILNTIDLASVLVNSKDKPTIKLTVNDKEIKISTQSVESGSSIQTIPTIDTNLDQSLTLILNINFLQHILKAFDGENVTFNLIDDKKPILITNKTNIEDKFLILPIRA